MVGYNDDMKDLNNDKEFVLLYWISSQGMKFNSMLPRDKAIKMKEILDSKPVQSWIEELD
jgi:hypothetical protein